ncbi:MAG: hypothetical protein ABSG46_03195 [Candidatus Binataceae bacterium]
MFSLRGVAIVLVVVLLTLAASPVRAGWVNPKVIGEGFAGSLAIDSSGSSHIAFFRLIGGNYNLVYVIYNLKGVRNPSIVTPLDGPSASPLTPFGGPAIATDPNNLPHVAVAASSGTGANELDYLTFDGKSTWTAVTVDTNLTPSTAFAGDHPPLIIDSSGDPHIAYAAADGSLIHAFSTDGVTWQFDNSGVSVAPSSIQIGSGATVHIAGLNSSGQVCEERDSSGSWAGECFANGIAADPPSVAFSPDGTPEVAYASDPETINIASFDGTSWPIQATLNISSAYSLQNAAYLSFAIDSAGLAQIMFATPGDLQYGVQQGSSIVLTGLGGGSFSILDISMALDSLGLPHATFWVNPKAGQRQLYDALTLPDLSAQWLSVASKIKSGKTAVTGKLQINNIGTASAAGFTVDYYLSADSQLSSDDTLLAHAAVVDGPGQIKVLTFNSPPLAGSVSGEYIIASINNNSQAEVSTTNPTPAIQIP